MIFTANNSTQNPTGEIKKISQHINAPLTDAELLKIVDKTSFNSMKKAANEALQGVKMFRKGKIVSMFHINICLYTEVPSP